MKPAFRVPLLIFALLLMAQHVGAEEWRGIKPLSSTRADVVRVFGECSDKEKPCEFTFENEDISIQFSGADTCNGRSDIVLLIHRVLRTATTMKTLGFDTRRFKSFDPSIPRKTGYRAYVNEESGLLFKTLRNEVFEIYYLPTNTDRRVCPYQYDPAELLRVVWEHVFMIHRVACPTNDPVDGERVLIVADYAITGQWLMPIWYTTGGRIASGQGTRTILLDTTGLAGKIVTVTIEVNSGSHHTAAGSCSFNVSGVPKKL